MISTMKNFSQKNPRIHHIHGTGRRFYEEIRTKERALCDGGRVKIVPYVDNVPELMRAADIVISRCGAMTLSELCAAGVAAILVPSPNVTDNHQYKNAKLLSDSHAAVLIEESKLCGETLITELSKLSISKSARSELAKRIKGFDKPKATERIVELIYELKTNEKLIKYIDIPLQHADDGVLKLMNRKGTGKGYLQLIEKLKQKGLSTCLDTSGVLFDRSNTSFVDFNFFF